MTGRGLIATGDVGATGGRSAVPRHSLRSGSERSGFRPGWPEHCWAWGFTAAALRSRTAAPAIADRARAVLARTKRCQSASNPPSPARHAAPPRPRRCRPTPASSFTNAPAAASCCGRCREIAACSAPTARSRARHSKKAGLDLYSGPIVAACCWTASRQLSTSKPRDPTMPR